MSVPMEISVQNLTDLAICEQNGLAPPPPPLPLPPSPPPPLTATTVSDDKILVPVEVCLKPSSTARAEDVRSAVERMLEKRSLSYSDGPVPVPSDDLFLVDNVQRIRICETDEGVKDRGVLLFWQVKPVVHVFQLSEEGPCEESSTDGQLSSFHEWILPAKEFDGMWESLIYEPGLKQRLLRYAQSALLFTEKGVDPFLVSWNRIILLHGPPGTGKTSLCKALAQKLSIRFNLRYPQCQLVEVNAHSLFSKWFSESGKLVARLFEKIQEMVEEENNLVFVLIDEVESLAAARKAALSGSEPSDSIRVVNALLTQMDKLKSSPNVIIMTTSNITAAIDVAFVDRADIKAYIGPPTLQARYEILRSCVQELVRAGILSDTQIWPTNSGAKCQTGSFHELGKFTLPNYATAHGRQVAEGPEIAELCKILLEAAETCEGLSGRSLRRLPFLTHASLADAYSCDLAKFLCTMIDTAKKERSELPD